MHVLLTEDNALIASGIVAGLEAQGFSVAHAATAGQADSLLRTASFDLMILDLGLPDEDGLRFLQRLRRRGLELPVLILTARDAVTERVSGLQAGADDYLVKPFEFREFIARIKVLTRRGTKSDGPAHLLKVADLELNLDEKVARRGGKHIDLTAKEFALLEYLMRNRNRVVSRVDIAEKVWDIHFDTGTNVIDVYINFLRKKVDKDFPAKLIHTVVGMGYIFKEE